jgi:Holliday junction resolvase
MTPEAKVKAKLKKHLEAMGIYNFSPVQNGMGRAGIPDVIGCYNGLFVAFECKANGNKPTPLQLREIERIQQAEGLAFVIDEHNVDNIKELLKWNK